MIYKMLLLFLVVAIYFVSENRTQEITLVGFLTIYFHASFEDDCSNPSSYTTGCLIYLFVYCLDSLLPAKQPK